MSIKDFNMAPGGVACRGGVSENSCVSQKNNPFAIPRGLKLYIVKARRSGGSIVLTCPQAEPGEYYHVQKQDNGVITFIPVALAVQEREV